MPILTKAQLEALNQASFPDNSSEEITPEILRTYNTATIESLVDSLDTGSFVTSAITGSSLITASFSGNTLTFTKGDSSTFGVVIPDVSGSTGNFATTGSNTFVGDQNITGSIHIQEANSEITLRNASGTGEVKITSGPDFITSFEPASLTGLNTIGANLLSGSSVQVGAISNGIGVLNPNVTATTDGDIRLAHGVSYNSFQSNRNNGVVNIKGDTITLNGSSSLDSGVSLVVKGAVSASVFTGSFVGNGSGLTNLPNQTIGLVTTSSFNEYTSSQDGINTALNASTASQQISIDALNSFTSSQESKNSTLGSVTASLQGQLTTIGTQSGSWVTESETGSFVTNISAYNLPLTFDYLSGNNTGTRVTLVAPIIDSSSLATTGSNNFVGNQIIDGNITAKTGSFDLVTALTASFGQINYVTGSATIIGDAFIVLNTDTPTLRYAGIEVTDSGSGGTASFQWDGDVDQWLIVDEAGKSAYVLSGPTGSLGSEISLTNNRLTKAGLDTQILDSSISDDGTTVSVGANLSVTGSIQSNGTSVLLDGALSQLNSFTSSQEITNTALNSFTASQESKDSTLATYTGSIDTKFDTIGTQSGSWDNTALNAFTSSQQILNAQFATTGSNTFNGNQIVNGLASQTFTAPDDNTQKDIITVTGANTSGKPYNLVNFSFQDYGGSGANYDDSFAFECYDSFGYNYGSELTINGQRIDFGLIASGSGRVGRFSMRDQYNGTTFSNLYADEIQIGEFAAGTNNRIGIGHTALPILELKGQNVSVTGSLSVSGSINTSVIPLTITSNTASLNASTGNTFQLNLVSGSQTRLEISGTKSGQTINLLVSQSASGPGTLVFGDGIEQPSGSFYSASQVASGEDILTMATFINANRIYVANVKNFI